MVSQVSPQTIGPVVAQQPPANLVALAYQHAGDWVRLANTITWTLASVYLVAAVFAMNAAVQRAEDDPVRLVLAILWIALLSIWLAIDNMYLSSAQQARHVLERIEAEWPQPYQFYTQQKRAGLAGSRRLTGLLYLSATVIVLAWVTIVTPVVCKPCAELMKEAGVRFGPHIQAPTNPVAHPTAP
jgi:hypothetical protein